MTRPLPSGTVTFLFTDVEGSTRLLHELGAEAYAEALAEHRHIVREACTRHGGVEVDTQGDAFFVAFPTAPGAVAAAAEMTERLAAGRIQLRIGLHTGTPYLGEEGYVGVDVHRAARIAAAGHGGQVLLSAVTAGLAGADAPRDLGLHRLKDLSAPERIYQLGGITFPPLKSLHQTNLPVPATPFLGRQRELAEVSDLLGRDHVRLLTLTGPGGTGKTRLALQAAAAVAERHRDGVWWVPLAAIRDAGLVVEAIGRTLGATDGVAEHIGERHLLLYLDNFEHLLDASADLAALAAACPNLRLLVTSREPLHVGGEHEYPVHPMGRDDAVQLFMARGRAIRPDLQDDGSVAEICRRVDDLPLAIELAAARVKVLPPAQILARLVDRLALLTGGARDAPERQRTLRATIAWSHDMLGDDEQRVFRRFAVFRGGCTLQAAEAVTGADLDTLQSLIDKSLVRIRDEGRCWLLETIREFADERLGASGERDEVAARHADHYLALAEETRPEAPGRLAGWLDTLEQEHANLRAALDRLEATGDTQRALRLVAALAEYWGSKGHLLEGAQRIEQALDADASPTLARARALNAAADFASASDDASRIRRWADEALRLSRSLGDTSGIARALLGLGDAAAAERDMAAALPLWEESATRFERLGHESEALLAWRLAAWAHGALGERDRARDLHHDNIRRARAIGDRYIEAHSLEGLASMSVEDGRPGEAIPMLEEAHRIHRTTGDVYRLAMLVCRFASALGAMGRLDGAATALAAGEVLCREAGADAGYLTAMNAETWAAIRGGLDDEQVAAAVARGRGLGADEAVAIAIASAAGSSAGDGN